MRNEVDYVYDRLSFIGVKRVSPYGKGSYVHRSKYIPVFSEKSERRCIETAGTRRCGGTFGLDERASFRKNTLSWCLHDERSVFERRNP